MANAARRRLPPLKYEAPPPEVVGSMSTGDVAAQIAETRNLIDKLTTASHSLLKRGMELIDDPQTTARDVFYGYAVIHDKRQMLIDQLGMLESAGSLGYGQAREISDIVKRLEREALRRAREKEREIAYDPSALREEPEGNASHPGAAPATGPGQSLPTQGRERPPPVSNSHGWARGPRT